MTSPDPRMPGRPRNPDIDERILDAALDIYAQRGWSGLTMHEVARRAGIGKAALYLRWSSKEDLLGEAFAAGSPRFAPEDAELPPRELLLDIGIQMRRQYTGRFGRAMVRLALDADQVPELYQRLSERFYQELDFGIRALDDAGAPNSLPPDTGSIALIEALGGAILMRTLFTARWDDPHGVEATDEFVRGMVDMLAPATTSSADRRPRGRRRPT
jgi:AcrR family transcriptional regulator